MPCAVLFMLVLGVSDWHLIPGILSLDFLVQVGYLSVELPPWHPPCIQLKADLKMTSLFYGFSTLLMAAAHYTLCDDASVVEASAISLWGDLAAAWLLAIHKPLALLVLTGTVAFAWWVVMSVVKREIEAREMRARDDATGRVLEEVAQQLAAHAVQDITNEVANEVDDERVAKEVERFVVIARMEIALDRSDEILANISQRLKVVSSAIAAEKLAATSAAVAPLSATASVAAPDDFAENGMSRTGPFNSGSIPVDTSKRSYVGGGKRGWQKRVAAATEKAEKAGVLFEEQLKARLDAAAASAALQTVLVTDIAPQIDLEEGETSDMELEDGGMSPSEIRLHDFNVKLAEIKQMKRKLFEAFPEFADPSKRVAARPRNN